MCFEWIGSASLLLPLAVRTAWLRSQVPATQFSATQILVSKKWMLIVSCYEKASFFFCLIKIKAGIRAEVWPRQVACWLVFLIFGQKWKGARMVSGVNSDAVSCRDLFNPPPCDKTKFQSCLCLLLSDPLFCKRNFEFFYSDYQRQYILWGVIQGCNHLCQSDKGENGSVDLFQIPTGWKYRNSSLECWQCILLVIVARVCLFLSQVRNIVILQIRPDDLD